MRELCRRAAHFGTVRAEPRAPLRLALAPFSPWAWAWACRWYPPAQVCLPPPRYHRPSAIAGIEASFGAWRSSAHNINNALSNASERPHSPKCAAYGSMAP